MAPEGVLLKPAHRGSHEGVLLGRLLQEEFTADEGHPVQHHDLQRVGGADATR